MPSFQYGNTTLEYSLEIRSNKNDVSISVEWIDGIKVIAPKGINEKQLQSILFKKAPWILDKWKSFSEIVDIPKPKEFVSGEKFNYLGRNYTLKLHKNDKIKQATLQFSQGRFISEIPSNTYPLEKQEKMIQLFKDWYIEHGTKKIQERLEIYSPKMGVSPHKIAFKEQKIRWGTCTTNGSIYLNWRILMAPIPIVDYLLVHELAHIKYPNHSNDYWNFVQSIIPDYKERKKWLRINGPKLTL